MPGGADVRTAGSEAETSAHRAGNGVPQDLPLPQTLALAALASAACAQGAYYLVGQVLAGSLLLAAVAAARTSAVGTSLRDGLRFGPAVACGVLGLVNVLSAAAVGDPFTARAPLLLLAGCVVVALLFRASTPARADPLASGLIMLGVIIGLSGWIGVALRFQPWALEDGPLWRAATTLTYANAAAGLLAPLALLALGRLARRPTSRPSAAGAFFLLLALGATVSRGGVVALAAGAVFLVVHVGWRPLARAAGGAVLGSTVALVALAPSMPADRSAHPALAVGGLIVGLAISVLWATGTTQLRSARRLGAGGLVVVLALGAFGSAAALGSVVRAGRLKPTSSDRVEEARAALRVGLDHPVIGAGPGAATFTWRQPDGTSLSARYAHNEYLQVFAELGLLGAVALVALGCAVIRSIRRTDAAVPADFGRAGAVAGLVAFALHSSMDFLWHIPAIALVAAALVGLACPLSPKEPS